MGRWGLPLFLCPIIFLGCPFFGSGDETTSEVSTSITQKEKPSSSGLALAVGGVRDESDRIVIDQALKLLDFTTDDTDLISIEIPPGKTSFTTAKQARVVAKKAGIAFVTPKIDARKFSPVQVTIPPQCLIQILMGEARGQLRAEATLDEDENVKATSLSVTGDALAAVIRNRIDLINDLEDPGLFEADAGAYGLDPPLSYYEAVIEANDGEVYQFSPLDPAQESYDDYLGAALREGLSKQDKIAYDQAVLTAADAFSGVTEDPTGGAFGFYSPTAAQFKALQTALVDEDTDLPNGAGTSDAAFPALAPVQVLILPEIAASTEQGEDVPSFVFVRERHPKDPAVVDVP